MGHSTSGIVQGQTGLGRKGNFHFIIIDRAYRVTGFSFLTLISSEIRKILNELTINTLKERIVSQLEILFRVFRDTAGDVNLPTGVNLQEVAEHLFFFFGISKSGRNAFETKQPLEPIETFYDLNDDKYPSVVSFPSSSPNSDSEGAIEGSPASFSYSKNLDREIVIEARFPIGAFPRRL